VTEVTFANVQSELICKDFPGSYVFALLSPNMKFRIVNLILAGALLFASALLAQQASVSREFAFAGNESQPSAASKSGKPRPIQGQRDVLELVGEKLQLSVQQRSQLETLMGHQHELLAQLHQRAELSDEQKNAEFQQIRRQTKEQFVAILSHQQRREFESMMR
jgi:plasmid maintenance system antidote protein VapI